jgi:dihydrofolate reductase
MRAMASPHITLIAAVARNGVIGRGNELVFREPADHKHFRDTTLGHPVLMGRKTWDSLPARFRPLPGRRNLVLSRDSAFAASGAEVVHTLEETLQLLQDTPRLFVMGGAQVYALALPQAQTLELTEVDADLEGNIHFPPWDRSAFEVVDSRPGLPTQGLPFRFVTYRRR